MITLKQLTYALAVDKTKHFKKAAEMCSVSQSALSTAISELESQLGIQIFERDTKRVLTTKVGEDLLEKARDIKIRMDDLYQLSKRQTSPLNHPLSIGVIPTIGPYLLPKVLPEVRKQYPDLELTILEEQSHVLVEMVKNGDIDAGILALPYPLDGLHAFEFWQEDFFMVAHNTDSHAQQVEITSDEIRETRLLLLKDGHCLKEHAMAACKLQATEGGSYSMSGASLYTLIHMVAGRMGTTLVPQMALDQLIIEGSELKAVHLDEPGPHRTIAFITRLNYAGVKDIELLMNIFREQLKKYCTEH
ncbi:hydrogen peroxide-inducible genes activator [Agarilytica rhodophyticola]|uniref:hydrogen peroxide-inducible genes activator n=1 Tax=Agarilytica rhodophyticola TaxID=1737490 RepID=UPI000B348CD1|nr:hydrogen peroxide-inducible genes activator [Agarilytica rhodophyticola]